MFLLSIFTTEAQRTQSFQKHLGDDSSFTYEVSGQAHLSVHGSPLPVHDAAFCLFTIYDLLFTN
jgi:hypothetical protein